MSVVKYFVKKSANFICFYLKKYITFATKAFGNRVIKYQ